MLGSSVRRKSALHAGVRALLLVGALAPAQLARAQTTPEPRARALADFQAGERCYSDGRFACAAALFHQAYATYPEPVLLFNLARACEDLGDLPQAADAYETFLREAADVPDRGAVRARIDTIRSARQRSKDLARAIAAYRAYLGEERSSVPERAWVRARIDALTKRVAEIQPQAPAEPPRPRSPSPVPWIVAGTGVAGVGVALGIGAAAKGRHEDAVAEPRVQPALELQDDAERLATVANVVLVAGALVATTGLVWGILDVRAAGSSTGSAPANRLAFAIGPGSAALRGAW